MTKKAPYKGLGADSEEKREPVSDINIAAVDSLKVLDPNRPIREADIELMAFAAAAFRVRDVRLIRLCPGPLPCAIADRSISSL